MLMKLKLNTSPSMTMLASYKLILGFSRLERCASDRQVQGSSSPSCAEFLPLLAFPRPAHPQATLLHKIYCRSM